MATEQTEETRSSEFLSLRGGALIGAPGEPVLLPLHQLPALDGFVQAATAALHFVLERLILAVDSDHPATVLFDHVARALLAQARAAKADISIAVSGLSG